MKLQIKYNVADFTKALEIAKQTAEFADIIEIGSLLILSQGINAINTFKKQFPQKPIYVDSKISSKGDDAVKLLASAKPNYVSVLAGTYQSIIKDACKTAKQYDIKIVLDLINSHSLGQSAVNAKILGAQALLIHKSILPEESSDFFNLWQQVKANANVPVFIKGHINQEILPTLLPLKPHGFVIGGSITKSNNPHQTAKELSEIIKNFKQS